jgi:hypothetical protein
MPSGTGTPASDNISLTLESIRNELWDITNDNLLLDEQEFSNTVLSSCRERVIEKWNATPPQRHNYTVNNFPDTYTYYWRIGAVAEALKRAAFKYLRNDLPYQQEGLVVQDQNKYTQYMQMGQVYEDKFDRWMHKMKVSESIKDCYMKYH